MKKSVCLLVIFAAIAMLAFAAPAGAADGAALKAGLTMSKFTGSDADLGGLDPDYRLGFAIGISIKHELSPTLAFQPEVYYAMKGAKYENGGDSVEFKFTYLQIPLLLRMQPEGSNFFFYGGPDVGINLNAKVEAEIEGVSGEEDLDDIKSLDFGLTFGAGVAMEKFRLEARYTIGLTSFDDSPASDDVKNSGLMFLIGMGL